MSACRPSRELVLGRPGFERPPRGPLCVAAPDAVFAPFPSCIFSQQRERRAHRAGGVKYSLPQKPSEDEARCVAATLLLIR